MGVDVEYLNPRLNFQEMVGFISSKTNQDTDGAHAT